MPELFWEANTKYVKCQIISEIWISIMSNVTYNDFKHKKVH